MQFVIEKLNLTEGDEAPAWNDKPLVAYGETTGSQANEVLTAVVLREGGVEVGIRASYRDGCAITVARKGTEMYALRATPSAEQE